MAYVTIPKDLSKVKNKVFLNLTKRQLICMGFAASIGVPFYFLTRETLGTSNAAAGMVLLMLPEFFFALFEKNGIYDKAASCGSGGKRRTSRCHFGGIAASADGQQ